MNTQKKTIAGEFVRGFHDGSEFGERMTLAAIDKVGNFFRALFGRKEV